MPAGRRSQFSRNLERALLVEAREDVRNALRVGVCMAAGLKRAEIGERLELTPAEVRAAAERVKRAAPHLDD